MDSKLESTSKFLSLVLRHKPETINVKLDSNGWLSVKELFSGCALKNMHLTMEQLEEIVETNNKKRFEFNADKTKIRACQGHSIDVDVELKPYSPPDVLYHGTSVDVVPLILEKGINKMSRNHVHLSDSIDTAKQVGGRHGKPVVLAIDTRAMKMDNITFYYSNNKVWLCDNVPVKYIKVTNV